MHWVDRGPEPDGLEAVRSQYTPRWVEYYRDGMGARPSDTRWLDFVSELRGVFFDLCSYCEEVTRGEVEHFRPKSRFPESVYEWSNWTLACRDCNHAKLNKWPPRGYVDPCARSRSARPENFFDFDTLTGEVIPKAGLSTTRREKAQRMIVDLRLNEHQHLKSRLLWLRVVAQGFVDDPRDDPDRVFMELVSARTTQFSSITRAWMFEQGFSLAF